MVKPRRVLETAVYCDVPERTWPSYLKLRVNLKRPI